MSDITVIHNARLLQTREAPSERYKITIIDGKISAISLMAADTGTPSSAASSATLIDVADDWITLGAVDLQINGALGLAFPDLRPHHFETLEKICDLLWHQGIDSFCPTLVTTTLENFHGALSAMQQFQQQQKDTPRTAKILGAHLEGPFLNAAKRGAHPQQFLQSLSLSNVKTVVDGFSEIISIMTLAPECATEKGVVEWLSAQGITVSLGHSLATAQQAATAFDQGAAMVTHAFNAMPPLHHREPSLLGAALTDSRVFIGFIADGQHICPTMLDLLLRIDRGKTDRDKINDTGKLFLVSDALSPLGLPDGIYPWDTREIEVTKGTARLADGTLSGTTLPLIKGAQNLVEWGLCGIEEAIALVTQTPRQAIGLSQLSKDSIPDTHASNANLVEASSACLIRWQEHPKGQLTWERLELLEEKDIYRSWS